MVKSPRIEPGSGTCIGFESERGRKLAVVEYTPTIEPLDWSKVKLLLIAMSRYIRVSVWCIR